MDANNNNNYFKIYLKQLNTISRKWTKVIKHVRKKAIIIMLDIAAVCQIQQWDSFSNIERWCNKRWNKRSKYNSKTRNPRWTQIKVVSGQTMATSIKVCRTMQSSAWLKPVRLMKKIDILASREVSCLKSNNFAINYLQNRQSNPSSNIPTQ